MYLQEDKELLRTKWGFEMIKTCLGVLETEPELLSLILKRDDFKNVSLMLKEGSVTFDLEGRCDE